MPEPSHRDFIARLPFLRQVDPQDLDPVLQALEVETYSSGDMITQQGTPARDVLLILEGNASVIHHDRDGAVEGEFLVSEGQGIGLAELVEGAPWWGSLRANTNTIILRWPRPAISHFIQVHSHVLNEMKRMARMRKLLHDHSFPWLRDNEAISAIARKHEFMLYQSLLLPIGALILGLASWLWKPFSGETVSIWVAIGMGLVGIALGIWRWVDWGNDFSIVTNLRAVVLEKVIGIYDNRQETPMQWILSISVETGALGRLLGFGDLIIRTYTGEIVLKNIPDPYLFASIVEDQWMRYKHRRKLTDREVMVEALQERMSDPSGDDQYPDQDLNLIDRPINRSDRGESPIGLDRWTLKTRFEEDGVITYRKHWALLLRQVFAPTLLLVLSGILMALRLSGLLEELSLNTSILLGTALILISFAWWMYRYVDWANDIYQITPNHIVDVNKKPLAREIRMVAPLENILGTQIDRKGIFSILLNFGSVIANVGTSQFSFDGVYDPARVQQDIVFAQDMMLEHQADVERARRRDEVVEWLSVYHDEINSHGRDEDEGSETNGHPRYSDNA